jgi:hypothetical protein
MISIILKTIFLILFIRFFNPLFFVFFSVNLLISVFLIESYKNLFSFALLLNYFFGFAFNTIRLTFSLFAIAFFELFITVFVTIFISPFAWIIL